MTPYCLICLKITKAEKLKITIHSNGTKSTCVLLLTCANSLHREIYVVYRRQLSFSLSLCIFIHLSLSRVIIRTPFNNSIQFTFLQYKKNVHETTKARKTRTNPMWYATRIENFKWRMENTNKRIYSTFIPIRAKEFHSLWHSRRASVSCIQQKMCFFNEIREYCY